MISQSTTDPNFDIARGTPRTRSARLVCLTTTLLVLIPASADRFARAQQRGATQPANAATQVIMKGTLAPGNAIEAELAGNIAHVYELKLTAGQLLRAIVDERGVNVVVTLLGPDGEKLLAVNLFNIIGPEPVSYEAQKTGTYRLDVRPVSAESVGGRYQIASEVKTSPTTDERKRLQAERLLIEAVERAASKELWLKAIEKYEQALTLWRELPDQYWEAFTISAMGNTFLDLGERQKAIESYERAVAMRQSIHDQRGVAISLFNLGRANSFFGDKQKALNFFDRALPFVRQTGSAIYEAFMLNEIGMRCLMNLKEPEKALGFLNQALSIERSLNDRSGETYSLQMIGYSYFALGQKQKALDILLDVLDRQKAGYQRWGQLAVLYKIAGIYSDSNKLQNAIEYYVQALPIQRADKNQEDEAITLNRVGALYIQTGDNRKAIEYFNLALAPARAARDRKIEVTSLTLLATTYESLNELPKAFDAVNQWLALSRSSGDRAEEANAIHFHGVIYAEQGELAKAEASFEESLVIFRAGSDRSGEALSLLGLGMIYFARGQTQRALDALNAALSLFKPVGEEEQKSATLQMLSFLYSSLGDKKKAEESSRQAASLRTGGNTRLNALRMLIAGGASYNNEDPQKALNTLNEALKMFRDAGDRNSQAIALNVMSGVYVNLGEYQRALDNLNQSLQICKAVGNRLGENEALANIGLCYYGLKMYPKALEYMRQGLTLIRATGVQSDEAILLGNIGYAYDKLGQGKTALDFFKQSLSASRRTGARKTEAAMLTSMGEAYRKLGEPRKSLKLHTQALAIFREVGSLRGEAGTFNNLMELWKDRKKPRLAILYGKLAVNVYQQTRRNIRELDKGLQASYLKAIEDTYRQLADLLVSDGRLPEAQQVLGLLKEEEYFAFVRRDPTALSLLNRSDLTQEEAAAIKRYDENAGVISKLAQEFEALRKQGTSHENPRYQELKASLEAANRTFQVLLRQLEDEFGKASVKRDLSESGGLRADLQEWGNGTVALYTLVGEKNYRVILTTPNLQVAREANPKITAVELNKLVLDFREAVQNPNIDPRPLGQKLYNVLIGPIAKDLEAAGAKTLVWSLDGTLRYVPLAALHDGRQYMAERFQNVVITPASHTRLNDVPTSEWHGLGLGVSKGLVKEWGTFIPLPSVPDELRGIIREDANSQSALGVMPGRVMLDESFTEKAMEEALEGGRYPLVHIASHFAFKPGNEADSFLLLGNGDRLTLDKINMTAGGKFFYKVELLTLSACDTATGGNANGKEVEGFAVLAQRQGAQAVLATLWPVADNSTQHLMERFYQFRVKDHLSKAESLRRAQMTLFNGNVEVDKNGPVNPGTAVQKDLKPRFIADPAARFAHPYYWAPFILIGNWR